MLLIALGSNATSSPIGSAPLLDESIGAISERIGAIDLRSSLFGTPCFPAGAGPDYANAVIRVATSLAPAEVLEALHGIEAQFGRVRKERWGQRTLDLDLIADGDRVLPDVGTWRHWADLPADRQQKEAPTELILPHPRLQDRAFVLVPLAEIAPDWRHPVLGETAATLRDRLTKADLDAVVRLEWP